MATIGGKAPSREAALAMIAQVERQAGLLTRRYGSDDGILDRVSDFRTFIDQLGEFHLFLDMVENRLGSIEPDARAVQAKNLVIIRWNMLEMELEISSLFLDRMATSGKPWPMGSHKFLHRRLTRLDDIARFHSVHGAALDLTPPNAGLMQNIRDRVDAQIDKSIPLADFGAAPEPAALAMPDEPGMAEAPAAEEPVPQDLAPPPVVQPPPPPVPDTPATESRRAPEPQLAPPPPSSLPEVMIPGMMVFTPPVSTAPAAASQASATPVARPPAAVVLPPDLLVPPAAPAPVRAAPAPSPSAPPATRPAAPQTPPESLDFGTDYISQKAKAVEKLAEKSATKAAAKPGALNISRRDFRLKVRSEADGYQYIEGNGLAVITEVCRIANTTIDELAKTLELSRPGLVLILNGRDPVSSELLKVLRRLVLRTGGLA